MTSFSQMIVGLFKTPTTCKLTRQQQEIEDYLSQSVDRVDLEHRERKLAQSGKL